jgi:hypothetical protein
VEDTITAGTHLIAVLSEKADIKITEIWEEHYAKLAARQFINRQI